MMIDLSCPECLLLRSQAVTYLATQPCNITQILLDKKPKEFISKDMLIDFQCASFVGMPITAEHKDLAFLTALLTSMHKVTSQTIACINELNKHKYILDALLNEVYQMRSAQSGYETDTEDSLIGSLVSSYNNLKQEKNATV